MQIINFILLYILNLLLIIVLPHNQKYQYTIKRNKIIYSLTKDSTVHKSCTNINEIEKVFINYNLVNIKIYDTTVLINLKYSSIDNFAGIDFYGNFNECYLEKNTAIKLANAQKYLKLINPNYSLIVYDAARPQNIQKIMWDSCNLSKNNKFKYLSNPEQTSLHNYGVAIDISIVDKKGNELDMGSEFDCFNEISSPSFENEMLKKGKLSINQINNRNLLRKVMKKAGFSGINTEWWHFNSTSKVYANKNYKLILSDKLSDVNNLTNNNISNIKNPIITINNNHNIIYKVQIMTSNTKLKNNSLIFKGFDVSEYFHKGLYKYTTGDFNNLDNAKYEMNKIRKAGFKDAFIVKFMNNIRVE